MITKNWSMKTKNINDSESTKAKRFFTTHTFLWSDFSSITSRSPRQYTCRRWYYSKSVCAFVSSFSKARCDDIINVLYVVTSICEPHKAAATEWGVPPMSYIQEDIQRCLSALQIYKFYKLQRFKNLYWRKSRTIHWVGNYASGSFKTKNCTLLNSSNSFRRKQNLKVWCIGPANDVDYRYQVLYLAWACSLTWDNQLNDIHEQRNILIYMCQLKVHR